MTTDELWRELEKEALHAPSGAWLTRLAAPQPGHGLLVAFDVSQGRRALLAPVPPDGLSPKRAWPECRGLDIALVQVGGLPHLAVTLRDPSCCDVFAALASDVATRCTSVARAGGAATELLGRLARWKAFLAAAGETLSLERQRGLWGELHFLLNHILPWVGKAEGVLAWRAPTKSHQDFQFTKGAIEVKATTAKGAASVRITSERQLDTTGVGALFLYVAAMDEREVPSVESDLSIGTSLPILVDLVRAKLAVDHLSMTTFDERLLDAGWLDARADSLGVRRWTLRHEACFQVREGFPRLVRASLPSGVADVSYAISLPACAPYEVPIETAMGEIAPTPNASRGRVE